MISYKCPLFPSKATQQKLAEALDACRWLHNKLLEKMNDAREEDVKLKTYDTQNMIPSLNHAKINHQRDDFLHKLSRLYVNNYDNICVEDLDVKGLKEKGRNAGMHRSIHDASWSKFMFMLSYKAESAGRKLIKVDPRNILIAGMEQPVAPIELKPLHRISVMQVLAMKWEAVPNRAR
ncbi:MAG: IS200/IS605 family accessory protein TnpB-related protein [Methanothrix sp.]|nr:IS200/IS605 family accessory protein TnpB-related protein [Methanothrix sp.]